MIHGDTSLTVRRPEDDLNDTIGKILRYGIVLSSAVLAIGLVLLLAAPPAGAPSTLQGTIAAKFGGPTLTPSAWLAGIAHGSAVGILQLGTLTLLATPLVRVAARSSCFSGRGTCCTWA